MSTGSAAAPRLAAVDLDGTLLTDSGALPTENADAIRAWIGSGRQLAILTSRSPTGVSTAMGEVAANCLVGCFNGALLYRRHPDGDGSGRYLLTMPRRLSEQSASVLWTVMTRRELPVLWYTASELFCNLLTTKARREIQLTGDSVTVTTSRPEQGAYKILCLSDPESPGLTGIESAIPENCSWTRSRSGNLEILDGAADKAMALHAICQHLNITQDQTLAIGDGDNDVSMLNYAGVSVTVSNGSRAALDAAQIVTQSNNDNGVARALTMFL